jgi:hypothetical protein
MSKKINNFMNKLIQGVKLLTCILEVFDINLCTILAEIFLSPSGQIPAIVTYITTLSCPPTSIRIYYSLTDKHGRAIAQEVSRWLPTASARVRARVLLSGICGGQSGAGAGFLRVLRFPLTIFIPPNSPSS